MRLIGNRANHNGKSGIEIICTQENRAEYNILIGNECYNNGQQSMEEAGIKINPKEGMTINNCVVNSNTCFDNQIKKTQDYGIIENQGAQANIITGNLCSNNRLQDIKISDSSIEISQSS